ncbi:H-NS family nucleoid-associated regulatory protein [Xanthomonas axonopodis pv. poinsettiicola]|uniref:H-NS histone family protein n=1 Tax=Xanthomonas TaxID=338 RepID=UPI001E4DF9CC|nr:H-NS family nucleoid-associated regulatory protein [Xanthomonas codiaei]MCC8538845.1 H-NS histone family protein [Xanthomonas codiaei]
MSIDLTGLSAKQLSALIKNAKKQQTVVAKRAPIAKVRTQLTRAAKAQGYSIEELFGAAAGPGRPAAAGKPGPRAGRKLGKVPPKYRNPANPQDTWTGRGKQPRWLAELTAAGKKVEDFLISKVGGGVKKASAKKASPRKTATKRAAKKSKAA